MVYFKAKTFVMEARNRLIGKYQFDLVTSRPLVYSIKDPKTGDILHMSFLLEDGKVTVSLSHLHRVGRQFFADVSNVLKEVMDELGKN